MGFKSSCNHVNKGDVTALSPRPISLRLLLLLRCDQKHIRTRLLSHLRSTLSLSSAVTSEFSTEDGAFQLDSILHQNLSSTICLTFKLSEHAFNKVLQCFCTKKIYKRPVNGLPRNSSTHLKLKRFSSDKY